MFFGVADRVMESCPDNYSPPKIKDAYTQNAVNGKTVVSVTGVFRPDNDSEDWEFRVKLYRTGVPEENSGPRILRFLNEKCRIFRPTKLNVSSSISVVWKVLH